MSQMNQNTQKAVSSNQLNENLMIRRITVADANEPMLGHLLEEQNIPRQREQE